ncbi:MAG: thiamine-phosphate pyrophosphorylase [Candidatus Gygaella obscura]|nr:thiamine-phosphate pyrophosphorylase [Candidatus Gygaella obscura]
MQKIIRLIDANTNRCLEGLRVLEDINRFLLDNRLLTKKLKNIRHKINREIEKLPLDTKKRLIFRDIKNDIGKTNIKSEFSRKNYRDIYFANFARVKESLRVIEEFSKIYSKKSAVNFKRIRYTLYEIEKKSVKLC